MHKLKIGVMISGRGSNLQALIDACKQEDYPAEIAVVISNKSDAFGLERARSAGIQAIALNKDDYADQDHFEQAIDGELRAHHVELVCLAGYMRILGRDFVTGWKNRMINIHPSLLPAFKGLHTHKRAIESGCRYTGCTIHYVVPDLDSGPIIMQAAIPIADHETHESLSKKVLPYEHQMYPAAVKMIAEGKVRLSGSTVVIKDMDSPNDGLINPCVNID